VSNIIEPGAGVLYMKVGTHADESLEAIIERKQAEIEAAGFGLWGYGGNTCHPTTMVQPFARDFEVRGGEIRLVMHPMASHHFAVTARAVEMSTDGREWTDIPETINVIGSRYALVIRDLEPVEFALPLAQTKVAAGNSRGRPGNEYIQGRVDKAVLEVVADVPVDAAPERKDEQIGLAAKLVEPYAVFVRL
jgi:hypothetical protein